MFSLLLWYAYKGPPVQAAVEEFVDFMDSRRLFSCRVPASFLRAERNKDRRGTVFVAGDYNKAEVLSVQVVSAYDLLTGAGENWLMPRTKRYPSYFKQGGLSQHQLTWTRWMVVRIGRRRPNYV